MRFCFLTLGYHPDLAGGAYRYVAEVAERLAAREHDVHALFPNPANKLAPAETRAGVHLHRYPDATGPFFQNWRDENASASEALRHVLNREPTAIVLCHAYLGPAAKPHASRTAFLFTGPWAEEFRISQSSGRLSMPGRMRDRIIAIAMRQVEGQAIERSRRILTISEYYRRMLPRWHAGTLPPIEVISGGVDSERFRPAPDRDAARAKFGIAAGEFALLTVRRLERRMGLDRLIAAFAAVVREHPNAQLLIAGDGTGRDALARQIASLQVGERVSLLGFVPEAELPALYTAADCVVMPSVDLEGFGLATVEALACGTPVIGSRAGATPEILEPFDRSLLYDAESGSALRERLRSVLNNPAALPGRGRCREYAATHFPWSRPVDAIERTGAALLETQPQARA